MALKTKKCASSSKYVIPQKQKMYEKSNKNMRKSIN